jgi:uncharacterized protein with FMN-binding domain
MITPELITYIRQQLSAGVPKETIAKALAPSGWSPQDIAQAFASITPPSTPAVAPVAAPQVKSASHIGTKIIVSSGLIIASAAYAFFQNANQPQQTPVVATTLPTPATTPPAQPVQQQPTTPVAVVQTPVVSAPPPTPAPKPVGQYADGTYTGNPADAYYGTIQVQAIIQNGALANVIFLQYPSDRSTSRSINSYAMPILTSEAIQAQSANVNIVSRATDSSMAFQQSLGNALAQAKN